MLVEVFESIDDCPAGWDRLATSYFQKKKFLKHCECNNYCQQRYYVLKSGKKVKSCAVVYALRVNLLTFANLPSPIKIVIVGIPCSVSSPGIFGDLKHIFLLIKNIHEQERGLILCLNLEEYSFPDGWIVGRTLPTVVFNRKINNWNEYLSQLSSSYRRRYWQNESKFRDVVASETACQNFDVDMYQQYLAVYKRSNAKLERLPIEFFRNLGEEFCLTKYQYQKMLIGWNITLSDANQYYFLFGGINYKTNDKHSFYFNMLFDLLKKAIEKGKTYIDFGQTAEIPKMRLGGQLVEKRMIAFHRNIILQKLLKINKGILEYKNRIPVSHVFARQE